MRNPSKTNRLADWFWVEFQKKELIPNRYLQPDYRMLLSQCRYVLTTMKLDMLRVQNTLELMRFSNVSVKSPNAVYLIPEKTTGKTWYEFAENPMVLCPPIYDILRFQWFIEKFGPERLVVDCS